MEAPTLSPEATDAAASEASAPESADRGSGLASFDEALRSGPAPSGVGDAEPTTQPQTVPPGPARSAPPRGDVKADVSGRGRRARAAEENLQRIADLERQLAERDPGKVREQVLADLEAEKARQAEEAASSEVFASEQADAERYARLRDLPDRDLSDEDYRWREERKALLASFPKARAALSAQAEQQVKAEQSAFWQTVRSQLTGLAHKPGLDAAAFKAAPDFAVMGEQLYEAGAEAERSRLQPKLDQALEKVRRLEAASGQFALAGRGGLAAARAPRVTGGRSGPAGTGLPDYRTSTASDLFGAAIRRGQDRAEA